MEHSDTLLTIKDVMAITGLKSRTSVYHLMKTDGHFPRARRFGTRGLRFRNSELQAYIRRLPLSDGGGELL